MLGSSPTQQPSKRMWSTFVVFLANALETARLFREKIANLAKAFDPVGELDEGFRALRNSFQSSAHDGELLAVEPPNTQTGLPN